MTSNSNMSSFDELFLEVLRHCGWESYPKPETIHALARLCGPAEIERVIAALDSLDDADLVDDAGDMADEYWRLRTAYTHILTLVGEPAVDPLLRALESKNPRTRSYAAEALGKIRTPRAFAPIAALLAHEPGPIPDTHLIRALGLLRDERAIELLLPLLRVPPDTQNRWTLVSAVAGALGTIGTDAVIPPLADLLANDPDPRARYHVAGVLKGMKHPKAKKVLKMAVNDPDEEVRYVARAPRTLWGVLFGKRIR